MSARPEKCENCQRWFVVPEPEENGCNHYGARELDEHTVALAMKLKLVANKLDQAYSAGSERHVYRINVEARSQLQQLLSELLLPEAATVGRVSE